ncbi:hypothetical protein ACQ4PT_055383 [Festuca glaucescens]
MAPNRGGGGDNGVAGDAEELEEPAGVVNFQLTYMAHEGNTEGICELLHAGVDPNFRGSDGHTAMHTSACEEHARRAAASLSVHVRGWCFFLSLLAPAASCSLAAIAAPLSTISPPAICCSYLSPLVDKPEHNCRSSKKMSTCV